MEGWFKQEIDKLLLGNGETFQGEAIIAVTKAALQAGVASDALSNLSSAGVVGGALLVVGADGPNGIILQGGHDGVVLRA